jgi:hypothetical protein
MTSALLLSMTIGCELDKTPIPPKTPQIVLEGVLNAGAPSQVVLLERARSGLVYVISPPYDTEDPVTSDAGIPETGATVTLITPSGQSIQAIEDSKVNDGKGEGVYRIPITGNSLVRDQPYHLLVQTLSGETLSAVTSVPDGIASTSVKYNPSFDRTRDTFSATWPASATAKSYLVRIETPDGPRQFFTQGTSISLPGMLRNVDVAELPHVFFPGFQQNVTVSAVDSNYYDWFRTHNDVISGEGLINRITGGVGVFGSLVLLEYDYLQVTAPRTHPTEGTFNFTGSSFDALAVRYLSFDIYIESPAARSGQSDALSGRYTPKPRLDYHGCPVCGFLGTASGNRIELALLDGWSARDTVEVFDGQLQGDTLTGYFRFGGGPFKFVRQ